MKSKTVFLFIALTAISCTKVYNQLPNQPTPVPTTNTADKLTKIEYRVTGNALSARVRYSTEIDGLVQTVTTLPFFTSFNTLETNLFLSLEVTPISFPGIDYPFLSAQIYAGGILFREATSSSVLLNTLSVEGNWRK